MRIEYWFPIFVISLALGYVGCANQPTTNSNSSMPQSTSSSATPSASPSSTQRSSAVSSATPITLPILDAFFASDQAFAGELKTKLNLTDEQVQRMRAVAREETSKLREQSSREYAGTTEEAQEIAKKRLAEIVGEDKLPALATFIEERWGRVPSEAGNTTEAKNVPGTEAESLPTTPNAVPSDTRIVINTPAYRMDAFENGRLIKSYKIGIGYPEFPLPSGVRRARAIIFNPTWTPPDEPWVESPKSRVRVGEKVEAGNKLNPLGVLKIPIGSPSLIHGGKAPAKLGTFASHGCVGLTDPLAEDFAKVLAQMSGTKLSDADISNFQKQRTETKQVTLNHSVPVELRYETIVAEDGKLHIFRDVYDQNTNTEDNLRTVLEANGVHLEDLTQEEHAMAMQALADMSSAHRKPERTSATDSSRPPSASPLPQPSQSPSPATSRSAAGRTPGRNRLLKDKNEIVIEIGALKGKGYPAPAGGGFAPIKEKRSPLARR